MGSMMDGSVWMMVGMMGGMGLFGLLLVVVVILAAVALVKHLGKQPQRPNDNPRGAHDA
ncbi:MAG: hypothetical protein ABIS17_10285 [Casimicrobiaceae bacterium]